MKKNLFIMVGVPGAGKTRWLTENTNPIDDVVISRDKIRFAMLKDDDDYFARENEVFKEYIRSIQIALDSRHTPNNVYCDATHINESSRTKLLDNLNLSNVDRINCIVIRPSIKKALANNAKRDGRERVPEKVIHRMYVQFERPEYDKKYRMNVRYINE